MATEDALQMIVRVVSPYVGETMARSSAAAHCQKLGIGVEIAPDQLEALIARFGSGFACSARTNPPPLVQTSRAPNAAIRA